MCNTIKFFRTANVHLLAVLGLGLGPGVALAAAGWEETFAVPFSPKSVTDVQVIEENGPPGMT